MTQVTIKEKMKWKGRVTFTNFLIECKEAEEIDARLKGDAGLSTEEYTQNINRLKEICKYKEKTFTNQIVSVGRQCFTGRLVGETTYTGIINYGALGTDATAVSDSDTILVAEVKRKGIATRSRTGNTASLRFYYSKADITGTFEEFGTFIDGTASADTGQLFNRVLTGGWTKSSSESLTVTVQFDLNAA